MEPIKPLDVGYKNKTEVTKADGSMEKHDRRFRLATEDIIAIFAGLITFVFALGMVFGKIPIDKLTVGVLSFSGIGAAIAEIIKAKRKRPIRKDITVKKGVITSNSNLTLKDLDRLTKIYRTIHKHYINDFHLFWSRFYYLFTMNVGLLWYYDKNCYSNTVIEAKQYVILILGFVLSLCWVIVMLSTIKWIDTWRMQFAEVDRYVNPLNTFSKEYPVKKGFKEFFRPEEISASMSVSIFLAWVFFVVKIFLR